jgi:hypothetical protein
MLSEFRNFMRVERGLSPKTVEHRCAAVRPFLHQLLDGKRSLATITVCNVDSLLLKKVNEEEYARVSVRATAISETERASVSLIPFDQRPSQKFSIAVWTLRPPFQNVIRHAGI